MYYLFQYLKHLLTATNQHGVHSPFVYEYLTNCLYKKTSYKASRSENVLLKSIPYFSAKRLRILSKNTRIENRIQKEFGLKNVDESPFDLIYLDNPDSEIFSELEGRVHNDTMLLLGNIHRNKTSSNIWEELKQNAIITVSMDMFYCGALFFRKEQAKQHFKIQI